MKALVLSNETEAEAVKELERAIERISDTTPAWLWDKSNLADLYEEIDTILMVYETSKAVR